MSRWKWIYILIGLSWSLSNGFGLKMVREGNLLLYYNEKHLKVKAYYYVENQKLYTYRYYYNKNDLLVKKEVWKKSVLISYYHYKYYTGTKNVEWIKYYVGGKLKISLEYNQKGQLVNMKKNL